MGKPTGFRDYGRRLAPDRDPLERIEDWRDFHASAAEPALREQAARCMDCGTPFCHTGGGRTDTRQTVGCPLTNLIPEWNDLVYRGRWEEALERLEKTNNFPEFTGKVCPAPCENACVLAINEPAVTIKNTEWSIIERAFAAGAVVAVPPTRRTGKRVAVVGSGPAGLACADQLNKAGHLVTVLERADRIGGLLMYGIPNMKLEKHLVERRVNLLADAGVEFRTGVDVGDNQDPQQLIDEYDATVLCCGATHARPLEVPGGDLSGVHQAVEYLTANTKWLLRGGVGAAPIDASAKDALVVGGGDTGTDCVGTALRQGCRSISQIEIVAEFPERLPWPTFGRTASPDYGQQEAAAKFGHDPRRYTTTVVRFGGDDDGSLATADLIDVAWPASENGVAGPVPVAGSERTVPCQLALLSMGFLGPEQRLLDQLNLDRDARSNAKAAYGTYTTNLDGVFAAGDVRRGASLVVWAIMEGRGAARECDRYLMGETLLP
jgi:glutamate synthase (NADPH/NADH) small chain